MSIFDFCYGNIDKLMKNFNRMLRRKSGNKSGNGNKDGHRKSAIFMVHYPINIVMLFLYVMLTVTNIYIYTVCCCHIFETHVIGISFSDNFKSI